MNVTLSKEGRKTLNSPRPTDLPKFTVNTEQLLMRKTGRRLEKTFHAEQHRTDRDMGESSPAFLRGHPHREEYLFKRGSVWEGGASVILALKPGGLLLGGPEGCGKERLLS